MRKQILLGALSVVGLSLAAVAPIAAQAPGRGTPGGGPAVVAPGPEQAAPAVRRGGRRGGSGRLGGGPGGDLGRGRGGAGGRIAEALNLTDDQKASVEKLRLKSRDAVTPLVDRLQLARRELHRAVFAEKADPAATKKLSADVAALGQQIVEKRIETQRAFAALLTDEQRAKLRTGIGTASGRPDGRRNGSRGEFGPARNGGLAALDTR